NSDRQASNGKGRLNLPHENEVGSKGQNHVHSLQHDAVDKQARILDVAGDSVENGAGPVDIKEPKTQALKAGIELIAQTRHDFALSEPGGDHVVLIRKPGAQQSLQDNGSGKRGDDPQRGPPARRAPAKRINRCALQGVQSMADDIDDYPQELQ